MATVEGTAERYATAIALGVGVDRAREFPARVARLGKEDLVRVARAYMAPEVLHVAFLGDDRWLEAEQLGMGGMTTLSTRP
jgi:predicted Zn-dependent peptidase